MQDNRMSVKDSADFIGVHTNTIYEWIREGKLRADKEGKNYKINHMDVLDIYSSKSRVTKEKDTLLSIQNVKEEADELLKSKQHFLLKDIESLLIKASKLKEVYFNSLKTFNEKEDDIIKQSEGYFEANSKLDKDVLNLILGLRDTVEGFYELNDFIEMLNKMYKYKTATKRTLNEEIEINKALLNDDFKFIKDNGRLRKF